MIGAPAVSIESGVPMPERRFLPGRLQMMRDALKTMRPGDSFLNDDNKHPYEAAKQVGVRIKTRKTEKGYRVWKV